MNLSNNTQSLYIHNTVKLHNIPKILKNNSNVCFNFLLLHCDCCGEYVVCCMCIYVCMYSVFGVCMPVCGGIVVCEVYLVCIWSGSVVWCTWVPAHTYHICWSENNFSYLLAPWKPEIKVRLTGLDTNHLYPISHHKDLNMYLSG